MERMENRLEEDGENLADNNYGIYMEEECIEREYEREQENKIGIKKESKGMHEERVIGKFGRIRKRERVITID